jgi:hypothetical protein
MPGIPSPGPAGPPGTGPELAGPASGPGELAHTITHLQGRGWGRRPPPARGAVDQRSASHVMSSPATTRTPSGASSRCRRGLAAQLGRPGQDPPRRRGRLPGPLAGAARAHRAARGVHAAGQLGVARVVLACLLPGVPSRGLDHRAVAERASTTSHGQRRRPARLPLRTGPSLLSVSRGVLHTFAGRWRHACKPGRWPGSASSDGSVLAEPS